MHGINFSEIIMQSKESDRNVECRVRITFRRFHILDKFIWFIHDEPLTFMLQSQYGK